VTGCIAIFDERPRGIFANPGDLPYVLGRWERSRRPWTCAMTERPESAEERALVESAQRGDGAALRTLLERFSRPLYSAVILPRVGTAADADEVLRDSLSRAVERLESFRWTGAGFFPWLRQIAVNLIIDRARSRQRRTRLEGELETHSNTMAPMHHAGADEALIEKQERELARTQLERALATLNERYRKAVELRVLEERPREECAEALGVTVGNFDVILHRALAALRKAYGVT
jgi:RNA polymerase sigma-70 factor (ECF subfamily)